MTWTEEQMTTINKISKYLSNYYTFPGFDKKDIEQEANLIGLSIVHKFKEGKGTLENFLFVAIRNRLLSLRAKHYDDPKIDSKYGEDKKNIVGFTSESSEEAYLHPFYNQEIEEIAELVSRYIHPRHKRDYAKIKEGIYIGTKKRKQILEEVNRIYTLIMEDRVDDLEKQFQNG